MVTKKSGNKEIVDKTFNGTNFQNQRGVKK